MTTYTFDALVWESTYSEHDGDVSLSADTTSVSFVTDATISSFSYFVETDYGYGADVSLSGDYGTLLAVDLGDDDLSATFLENAAYIYAYIDTLEWGAGNETTFMSLDVVEYDSSTDTAYFLSVIVVIAGDDIGDISSVAALDDFIAGISSSTFGPPAGFGPGDDIPLEGIATISEDDDFSGSNSDDDVDLGAGNDIYNAKSGDDTVSGGLGRDTINGGNGNDTIAGNGGQDEISGGGGDDDLLGGSGKDDLSGGGGNDTLSGGGGADLLVGGAGNDTLDGDAGQDVLKGLAGRDTLNGGAGADELIGGGGRDTLDGGAGNDWLSGGAGIDILFGGNGSDEMDGGNGNDELYGGNGHDELYGGNGNDIVEGGSGDDIISGGNGDDDLYGDAGQDEFEFNSTSATGNDTIHDWEDVDTIRLFDVTADGVSVTLDGSDTLIEYGDGNVLTLIGISDTAAVISSLDFA